MGVALVNKLVTGLQMVMEKVLKKKKCLYWVTIQAHCPVTCELCDAPTSSPVECKDKNGQIFMGHPYGDRTCTWLRKSANKNVRDNRCADWPRVRQHCPVTCSLCSPPPTTVAPSRQPTKIPTSLICEDKASKIKMGLPNDKNCSWLKNTANKIVRQNRCEKWPKIRDHC